MKFFTTVLTFGLAIAAPSPFWKGSSSKEVETWDTTTCVNNIVNDTYDFDSRVEDLTTLVNKVKKNQIITLLKIQSDVLKLVSAIEESGESVNASCPDLELTSALGLVTPMQNLVQPITDLCNALDAKYDVFKGAILGVINLAWLVANDLEKCVSAIYGLGYAIRTHTPTTANTIVDNLVTALLDPIEKSHAKFDEGGFKLINW